MSKARRPLRFFVAGLMHETNSFSPIPTSMANFQADLAYVPPAQAMRDLALSFAGYGDAIRAIRAAGDEAVEGPCFWAQPSGPISADLYARLRGEVLDALAKAGPLDGVLLVLHGAMMAVGADDCEADILHAVRERVGHDMPVGALLDLHGNVSEEMLSSEAVIIGVKEYPHIDYGARAEELHALLADMAAGARPTMTLRTIPWLSLQGTVEQPMRGLVDRMIETEGQDGIRSLTLMHGFPWADWSRAGASILVVSEGADQAKVDRLADDLADTFIEIADGQSVERLTPYDAVTAALAAGPGAGPIVISDSSDNPGGGAACDSTFLLRELIDRGCTNAALGMIWDPQAAQIAATSGVGTTLRLRIGGKIGPLSGDPVDLECEVLAVSETVRQRMFSEEPNVTIGLAVGLRAGGVDIVLNSIRQQTFDPECFAALGIDVSSKSIAVIKSSQHFRALFDPIARQTIYCDAPGSLTLDLSHLPYRTMQVTRSKAAFQTGSRPTLYANRRLDA